MTRVVTLKVTLQGVKPAIWRRLEIPADISLHGLHLCLQAAVGWSDSHLHSFMVDVFDFGPPSLHGELEDLDSRKQPLAELEGKVQAFEYTYDFGDDWQHTIKIESWSPAEAGVTYPRCIGGANACPPEDCGGDEGYLDLLRALADPKHPRHTEMHVWLGRDYDPKAFDLAQINADLKALKLKPIKPSKRPSPLAQAAVRAPRAAPKPDPKALLSAISQELAAQGTPLTPQMRALLLSLAGEDDIDL